METTIALFALLKNLASSELSSKLLQNDRIYLKDNERRLQRCFKGEMPPEIGNDDGQYTTIDAYGKCGTHMDEASGYLDIEDFPNEQKICGECEMVARNEEHKITCNPITRDNYPSHALITS